MKLQIITEQLFCYNFFKAAFPDLRPVAAPDFAANAAMEWIRWLLDEISHWMKRRVDADPSPDIELAAMGERLYEMAVQHDVPPDLILEMASDAMWRYNDKQDRWHTLTPREQEVTALVCSGHTNLQIAKNLNIQLSTVKTHIRNILQKFELHSKDQLQQYFENWEIS